MVSVYCCYYCNLLFLVNLVDYLNLTSASGVTTVSGPDGSVAYQLSTAVSASDTSSSNNWIALNAQLNVGLALYVQVDRNYSGNIIQWMSSNAANILTVDIIGNSSNRRLLNVKFYDQPSTKVQLLSPTEDFQTVSFVLTTGRKLSVYADCHLVGTSDLIESVSPSTSLGRVTIFLNATSSSKATVSSSFVCAGVNFVYLRCLIYNSQITQP